MTKNVLQCCYTNAMREAGEIVSSGWQAVCVSPDLPSDAFSTCTKLQNANSSIQNTMIDENGNVLNLFEICGDGSFVYVIRTKYGLLDRLGRANMFSHAFIFPCKDVDMIADPNMFLTLANENFKDNEEAAKIQPDELSRILPFEISEAMKYCGLDNDKLLILVKSVYAQVSDKKTTKPLFIQYDGTEDSMRALMFCIYYSIPLSLRRRLSVASVRTDNTVGKNIIFSKMASEQELYINPATGESTILTARTDRRLSRLGFLDFAVSNITHPQIQRYFEALENKTVELGDTTGFNELIMKIAHIQLTSQDVRTVADSELDVRLSDALRSNSLGNSTMDDYAAQLLAEITRRKLVLTDENEAALSERLGVAASSALLNTAEQYNFYRFNELPTSDAASKLSKMSEIVFSDYRKKLNASTNGRKILDYYYSEIMLTRYGYSWDGIQKVLDETSDITIKPLTDDKIDECAWKLYCNCFSYIKEGRVDSVVSEYRNYMQIMRQRLGEFKSLECGNVAKDAFWDRLSYDDIDFSMNHFYRDLEVDSKHCQRLLAYCDLPLILTSKGETAFFKAANAFFFEAYQDLNAQQKNVVEKVIDEAKVVIPHQNNYFERWCKAIFFTHDGATFVELINLYNSTKTPNINEILNTFNRFAGSCNEAGTSPSIQKDVAKIIASICAKMDSVITPVPLDGWLLLGKYLYVNSFNIFDDVSPSILSEDEYDVVSTSKLIRNRTFWDDANNYIQDRGREYKTVKKWLSAIQHLKKSATETRKGSHESNQSLFGRGMSALSKRSQDEQRQVLPTDRKRQQNISEEVNTDYSEHVTALKHGTDHEMQPAKKGFLSGLFEKK